MKVLQSTYRRSSLVAILLFPSVACTVASTCFGGVDHAPYLDWLNTNGDFYSTSACYNAKSTDTTQGFAVHWKLDEENIHIAVAARAEGWVGFGLAEAGGMNGADMIIFETANHGQVRDAHVLDALMPIDDVCQDWVFRDSRNGDGFIIFEAYRKLNTLDAQDRIVIDDSYAAIPAQKVVAAWGDSSVASFHGPTNVAQGSVRWHGTGDEQVFVEEQLALKADGHVDLTVSYTIQDIETEYVDFCFTWDPDITGQGAPNETVTVIAADAFVLDESRPFVHHADIFGSTEAANLSKACLSAYGSPLYSWSPGLQAFVLPDDVGFVVGPSTDNSRMKSFRVTMHYHNPELVTNVSSTTTVRLYYSLKPRQHELGIMGMGDVLKKLYGSEIPAGRSQFGFTCSSDCSSLALTEPVTVFQEAFHMHRDGLAAVTYQIRNNEIIRQANVDFFDFEQTGFPRVRQQPYTINPGDSFQTKFWFDSENGTVFGKSSFEEMIETSILYYPAKSLLGVSPWGCSFNVPIAACNASMSNERDLTVIDPLERTFGPTPSQCSPKATLTSTSSGQSAFHAMIPLTLLFFALQRNIFSL